MSHENEQINPFKFDPEVHQDAPYPTPKPVPSLAPVQLELFEAPIQIINLDTDVQAEEAFYKLMDDAVKRHKVFAYLK